MQHQSVYVFVLSREIGRMNLQNASAYWLVINLDAI